MEVIRKYCDQLNTTTTTNTNTNNYNRRTKINSPMNGLCDLKNGVYQAIIFPKENLKDRKKLILEFRRLDGNYDIIIIFICSLMNARKIKQLYPNIFGS